LLVVTVIFDEQVSRIGGLLCCVTVTRNEQLVQVPQVSHAVQFTVVVPIGKVLPLGGLQPTVGGLHPPLAKAL
jgi:hypothetical protein